MNTTQLKARIKKLASWADACQIARELYPTADKSTGTLAECFIAGWCNASDMIGANELNSDDWQAVRGYVLSETSNVHGVR